MRYVFDVVVTQLLGWDLDPQKSAFDGSILLLGLQVSIRTWDACWLLGEGKRSQWTEGLRQVLECGVLDPGLASKYAGRFAFLNHWVFNRVGRALLRPIIWRQKQRHGPNGLFEGEFQHLKLPYLYIVVLGGRLRRYS